MEPSIMSESDTMFNERYRRCAAVQHMLSADPSYDNRTIASTLKMQIRTVQHLRAQLNASDDPLEVVERKPKAQDTARKTRTKEFIEKVPGCAEECGDPLVQSGGRWQTLGVAAGLGAGPQVQSFRRRATTLYPSLTAPPTSSPDLNLLDYFVWSYVENITNMTSHNTKASLIAAIRQVFAELPPALVKRHASSSGSVPRLKAATLNRCQLYYIIKLPELIYSIKV